MKSIAIALALALGVATSAVAPSAALAATSAEIRQEVRDLMSARIAAFQEQLRRSNEALRNPSTTAAQRAQILRDFAVNRRILCALTYQQTRISRLPIRYVQRIGARLPNPVSGS